ncbi:chromosome partitioning protein ParB [Candidatus Borreliella tachyglossi]|uniref:Chromosome partitioning protein ParB n=1 Tax=Candidatus Borreliella tachyglossi TaxID=1964448 RepID=A0A2S1LWX4_9SPIR|nr:ParB/RepB/Spo0J family partition protein [Candidatus Borreliella tachyglossi]AWG42807.1 chromosome partitioning protein ParB [Candidatus Borreliella tachyglossi]
MKEILKMVDIELLDVDKSQPRKSIGLTELEELSVSIKENGILQPIVVFNNNGRYNLIIGERRFRAAKLADMRQIPVIEIGTNRKNQDFMSLIENIQRENLTPVEEAYAYKNLMNKHSLTQKALSEKIGKNRTHIANLVRILELEQEILNSLHKKEISLGHAKVLLSLKDNQDRYTLYILIIKRKLSVRDAENYVKNFDKSIDNKLEMLRDPFLSSVKEFLVSRIQTKINIKGSKEKGKIEISYFTSSDLKRIISIFENIK